MKILLCSNEVAPYGSGIANVIKYISDNLVGKKDIKLVILTRKGGNINIGTYIGYLPGIIGILYFWERCLSYIYYHYDEYDVIWLHSPFFVTFKNFYRINRKIIITFHTTYYGFYKAYKKYSIEKYIPYYYFASKIEKYFLKLISKMDKLIITAVSDSVCYEMHENGLNHYVYIIPNGFSMNNLYNYKKRIIKKILKEKYNVEFLKTDIILLYIGRITEVKQPKKLIEIFNILLSKQNRLKLLICGDGNLSDKIRSFCKKSSNIIYFGFVAHNDKSLFLKTADFFISSSCYEGLSLSVLEAISFKLPYILSDIPSHKFFKENKIGDGIYFDALNFSATPIINYINTHPRNKINNTNSIKNYSWGHIINEYYNLFKVNELRYLNESISGNRLF